MRLPRASKSSFWRCPYRARRPTEGAFSVSGMISGSPMQVQANVHIGEAVVLKRCSLRARRALLARLRQGIRGMPLQAAQRQRGGASPAPRRAGVTWRRFNSWVRDRLQIQTRSSPRELRQPRDSSWPAARHSQLRREDHCRAMGLGRSKLLVEKPAKSCSPRPAALRACNGASRPAAASGSPSGARGQRNIHPGIPRAGTPRVCSRRRNSSGSARLMVSWVKPSRSRCHVSRIRFKLCGLSATRTFGGGRRATMAPRSPVRAREALRRGRSRSARFGSGEAKVPISASARMVRTSVESAFVVGHAAPQ